MWGVCVTSSVLYVVVVIIVSRVAAISVYCRTILSPFSRALEESDLIHISDRATRYVSAPVWLHAGVRGDTENHPRLAAYRVG